MSDTSEVIVIRSGAGGGTMFHDLAASGMRILLLERGAWRARTREPQMERIDARQPESELAHVG